MSSPVDGNGKRDDPSAYAPKSVRDSNREGSHENTSIAEDKYPQQSEESVPEKAPARDQARSHPPFDTTFSREARFTRRTWSRRAESEFPEGDEEPRMPPLDAVRINPADDKMRNPMGKGLRLPGTSPSNHQERRSFHRRLGIYAMLDRATLFLVQVSQIVGRHGCQPLLIRSPPSRLLSGM